MTKYGFCRLLPEDFGEHHQFLGWFFNIISHTKIAHGDIPHFLTQPYSHLKIWDMMAIKKVDMILIWANDSIFVERATIGDTMFCPALLHELKQHFSNLCLEIEPEPLIPWHLQGVFFFAITYDWSIFLLHEREPTIVLVISSLASSFSDIILSVVFVGPRRSRFGGPCICI